MMQNATIHLTGVEKGRVELREPGQDRKVAALSEQLFVA